MGPSVLLDVEDIFVLLTSRRTAPSDLGQWRSQGVDPEKFRFIGIKAAVAYRRAYEAIAIAHYPIRIPGPCSSDLRSLNYKNIRRPIAPLDPIEITTSGTTSGFPHQSLETQKS
jgi:microcystin degradation protein MlrC